MAGPFAPRQPLTRAEASVRSLPGDFSQGGIRTLSGLIKASGVLARRAELKRARASNGPGASLPDALAALDLLRTRIMRFTPPIPATDNERQETVLVSVS